MCVPLMYQMSVYMLRIRFCVITDVLRAFGKIHLLEGELQTLFLK